MSESKIPNICFFDCESKKISSDFTDGWGTPVPHPVTLNENICESNVFSMELGMAATFDNEQLLFWRDVNGLVDYLLSDKVDAIVTFNGSCFDFPLILGMIDRPQIVDKQWVFSEAFKEILRMLEAKHIDILDHIVKSINFRPTFSNLVRVLRGEDKKMSGEDWYKYWTSGDQDKMALAVTYLIGDVVDMKAVYFVMQELNQFAYYNPLNVLKTFSIRLPPIDSLPANDNIPY